MLRRLTPAALALAVGLFLSLPSAAQAQESWTPPVIAVIDMQYLQVESNAARSVRAERDRYLSAYQAEAEEEERRLSQTDQELAQQRSLLSPEVYAERGRSLQRQLSDYQRKVQLRRRALEHSFGEAMEKINHKLVEITSELAEDSDVGLVLYRSQVFLYDEKLDLTEKVMERLNAELSSVPFTDPQVHIDRMSGNQ